MLLSASCSMTTRDNIEVVTINNSHASAEISLFGAHLLSFKPKHDNRERIWLSGEAKLDGKTAIRGGVPICWPWFGDHPLKNTAAEYKSLPSHGLVRTQCWEMISCSDTDTGTHIVLKPKSTQGLGFSGKANLSFIVEIGKQCSLSLVTQNIGQDTFSYSCALHTYFTVNNINQCVLSGLSGAYLDKTQGMETFNTPNPYRFSGETDRVHLCQPSQVVIAEDNIKTTIHSEGHDSIVVWNPWQVKSVSMQDMDDAGYKTMLCIETASTQGQMIAPDKTHTLKQVIK